MTSPTWLRTARRVVVGALVAPFLALACIIVALLAIGAGAWLGEHILSHPMDEESAHVIGGATGAVMFLGGLIAFVTSESDMHDEGDAS